MKANRKQVLTSTYLALIFYIVLPFRVLNMPARVIALGLVDERSSSYQVYNVWWSFFWPPTERGYIYKLLYKLKHAWCKENGWTSTTACFCPKASVHPAKKQVQKCCLSIGQVMDKIHCKLQCLVHTNLSIRPSRLLFLPAPLLEKPDALML